MQEYIVLSYGWRMKGYDTIDASTGKVEGLF